MLALLLLAFLPLIHSRPLLSSQPRSSYAHAQHSHARSSDLFEPAQPPLLDLAASSSAALAARSLNFSASVGGASSGVALAVQNETASSLDAVISAYALDPTPWTWTFPTSAPAPLRRKAYSQDAATLSDSASFTSSWLASSLNLYSGRVLVGAQNLDFVSMPSADGGAMTTALKVSYPDGSYVPSAAHSSSRRRAAAASNAPIGGTSFYPQPFALAPNSTSSVAVGGGDASRAAHLLRYTITVPSDFAFVKGGKLPGLYSSVGTQDASGSWDANTDACSGGARNGVGESCWSARLMWREGGAGEVYAYFPTAKSGAYDPCAPRSTMVCNDAYGTSIGRGSFSLVPGSSLTITLLVQLNSDPTIANGRIALWADDKLVVNEEGLLLRSGTVPTTRTGKGGGSSDTAAGAVTPSGSAQWVDKVFFSSFFGGSTPDFAAQGNMSLYFSDFSLHSGSQASTSSGPSVSASSSSVKLPSPQRVWLASFVASLLLFLLAQ